MTTKILVALFAVAALTAGCDKDEDAGGGTSAGVKECDEYFKAVEACMPNLPEAAQGPMKQGTDTFRTQVDNADTEAKKKAVGQSCKAAMLVVKNNPACK